MPKTKVIIPGPNTSNVGARLAEWSKLPKYVAQEKSLDKLFSTFSSNTDLIDVLIKVSCLNDFYSTNIFSVYDVAQHIFSIHDLDNRLHAGDLTLVNDIAVVKSLHKNFYSFASKFCSHHEPCKFPIYDYYVEKVLLYFKKKDSFFKFKKEELKNYESFYKILEEFRKFYSLTSFSMKEIDRYLWLTGKQYFPRKYSHSHI